MTDRVHSVEVVFASPRRDDDAQDWAESVVAPGIAGVVLGPVMSGDDYLRGNVPTWSSEVERLRARVAELEARLARVRRALLRSWARDGVDYGASRELHPGDLDDEKCRGGEK